MWKRPEGDPSPNSGPAGPTAAAPSYRPPAPRGNEVASIGPSIAVKGEISGEEDLVVQGRVEGKIDLRSNHVTVGKHGQVKADIYGRVIDVQGQVEGNLFGEEQVLVQQSGEVRGNITAPRVSLEDGANFKGSIDMEPKAERGDRGGAAGRSKGPGAGVSPMSGSGAGAGRGSAGEPPRSGAGEPVRGSGGEASGKEASGKGEASPAQAALPTGAEAAARSDSAGA
jgi:cytoskeletal protein CcmA (bactofilin family)